MAAALQTQGHAVSERTVNRLLHDLGYSLQSNRKTLEGSAHIDRDAQFRHIAETVKDAIAADQPAISVDTKKKELVGNFKNPGRAWRRRSRKVLDHDYPSWAQGQAIPVGIYDGGHNDGYVVVGTSHDTATFTSDDGTLRMAEAAHDVFDGVTFDLPHANNPWPSAGTVTRVDTVHVEATQGTNTDSRTVIRTIEVDFPADAEGNVTLIVGGTVCTLNLETHVVSNCH